MKINLKTILFTTAALILAIFMGSWIINRPAGDGSKTIDFAIKSGWSARRVMRELNREGMIRSNLNFRIMLLLKGKRNSLKKGLYVINDGMAVSEIITVLSGSRTKTISVTIPEGFNNRQIGDRLTRKKLFPSRKEFLKYASMRKLLQHYRIPAKSLEGYLFPDTYTFPYGYSREKIVRHMVENFFRKVNSLKGFPRDPQKRHKVVILASIVEREAQKKKERLLIAAVFWNRLKKGYPLESCATVQYLFDHPKKRLLYRHLKIQSPYNTYLNDGLPPGPIASPGLPALKATLNPAKKNYTYFVLKGDGSHHFSKSYSEHIRAKKKYLGR